MDHLEIPSDKREFHCMHCNGKILIPRNLPQTTGPCPHCGGIVTSPAPESPDSPAAPPPPPVASPPPPPPAPPKTDIPPPRPSASPKPVAETPPPPVDELRAHPAEIPHAKETPQAKEPAPGDNKRQPANTATPAVRQKSGLIPLMLVLLVLILGAGVAVYCVTRKMGRDLPPPTLAPNADKASPKEAAYLRSDWQKEAYQVLRDYMAATTSHEKLPFILNGESLASRLEDFYGSDALRDRDTPAEAFSVSPLTEDDYNRGIFMLVYNQPRQEPVRVLAFFKRTPEGLKLDWETFAQTKYRTLQSFLKAPKEGATGIFRVLMIEDTPDSNRTDPGIRTFRIADPAHTSDTTKIDVPADSEIGRALSAINWRGTKEGRPNARTATVELRWGGNPQAPELEISRFICWEFLGLGGQEITPSTAPKK